MKIICIIGSQMNILNSILSSSRTVFTTQSLALIAPELSALQLAKTLNYYVKKGELLNPRRGIYTKPSYNELEMAGSILRPSYISLEYVLARSGITFQYSEQITCVSYQTREIVVDGKTYSFRKINPIIGINLLGIEQRDNVTIATPERAFLDMIYLSAGQCYFDNLHPLDRKKVLELLPIYDSRVLITRVQELLK